MPATVLRFFPLSLLSLSLLTAVQPIEAAPFNSFDPRSFAMGGTGVASATSANASFFNPALLAAAHKDEDFSLELPIVGVRVYDRDNFLENLSDFQDADSIDRFADAIDGFNAAYNSFEASPTVANATAVLTAYDTVQSTGNTLITGFSTLSNRAVQGEIGAGAVIGVPSKTIGVAVAASGWMVGGAVLNISDQDISDVRTLINLTQLDAATAASLVADPALVTRLTDPTNNFTSNMQARGAVFREIGVSLAREFALGGHEIAVGVTPKAVKVSTFDYVMDINTADIEFDQGRKDYSAFNFDIGVAKSYASGFKTGVVIKNVLPKEYKTVLDHSFSTSPQARVAAAYVGDWFTLAADFDVTENEAVGFDSKTQYLGLGGEIDVFGLLQLRAGYRHNLSDTDTSVMSAGMGISPFGLHLDLGVAGNGDEVGGALQFGLRF